MELYEGVEDMKRGWVKASKLAQQNQNNAET